MKRLVVLSGKGGTGKTSVTAALADLASRERALVLVDADADAANLGLLLDPRLQESAPFMGSDVAVVDEDLCLACGACRDVCRFDAIRVDEVAHVDPTACEGCRACALECPEESIRMEPVRAGSREHSDTRFGRLFHGDLLPGQENSGKLVAALRKDAAEEARARSIDLVLIDGPPGIGCPAIAASTGTDLALLVTEPSLSALHDLGRVLGMLDPFAVPSLVCLNKADLSPALAGRIRAFLEERGVPLVGKIPYHTAAQDAVEHGRPLTTIADPALQARLEALWAAVRQALEQEPVVAAG